ncbi:MAG: NAD(P)-dependent oxidoreductase [Candidatus Shapirobacteria bacterium]|nr:NAD(P)-dependent oxidoreductase [Candidatus Shapirobacteria bacterium]
MKVLITGGNGFIAKNFKESFSEKYEIFAPSRTELDLLQTRQVAEYLIKNKFDVVIHAANYDAAPKHSTKDPQKVLENNLKMFFNIVRNEKNYGKMIFLGSGAEYCRENWIPKMGEGYFDNDIPKDQYGLSKYIMTKFALKSPKTVNLRLFAVYGKYEDFRVRVISNMCYEAVKSKSIHLRKNLRFDFLLVDDLVKIVDYFISGEFKERIFNVCSGEVIDFLTIAKEIRRLSGMELEIIIENKKICGEYSGDNSRLLRAIGGFEFTSWGTGVANLFHWFKDQNED